MEVVITIVIGVLLAGGLLWALLQPSPETTLGKENRARREVGNAKKNGATRESANHIGEQGKKL